MVYIHIINVYIIYIYILYICEYSTIYSTSLNIFSVVPATVGLCTYFIFNYIYIYIKTFFYIMDIMKSSLSIYNITYPPKLT